VKTIHRRAAEPIFATWKRQRKAGARKNVEKAGLKSEAYLTTVLFEGMLPEA
jgi:hypothetical protein